MRWGLIGASSIAANHMIEAIRATDGDIRSVLSSNEVRARSYAAQHDIPQGLTDLDAVLAQDALDAVYISTTNERHFAEAMAAIEAGKHVLCEKPLGDDGGRCRHHGARCAEGGRCLCHQSPLALRRIPYRNA